MPWALFAVKKLKLLWVNWNCREQIEIARQQIEIAVSKIEIAVTLLGHRNYHYHIIIIIIIIIIHTPFNSMITTYNTSNGKKYGMAT